MHLLGLESVAGVKVTGRSFLEVREGDGFGERWQVAPERHWQGQSEDAGAGSLEEEKVAAKAERGTS